MVALLDFSLGDQGSNLARHLLVEFHFVWLSNVVVLGHSCPRLYNLFYLFIAYLAFLPQAISLENSAMLHLLCEGPLMRTQDP